MIVREVMSRELVTLAPGDSLRRAIELMEVRSIRHLPVVEGARLVGILSDRDLLEATGWLVLDPKEGERHPTVAEHMRAPVKTAAPDDKLVSSALELVLHGAGCLPVLEHGRLVGIVTQTDLLATFVRAALEGRIPDQDNPSVEARMTRGVRTLAPTDSVARARELMRAIRTHHLPVVEAGSGRLVGLVSDRDLRWAEGRALDPSTPLEDLMSDFVVSVEPRLQLSLAASKLLEHKFSSLPVVDEGELVGILTTTDLLEHCLDVLWRD